MDIGKLKWELCLCLLAAWLMVYFALLKGIKSSGKVRYQKYILYPKVEMNKVEATVAAIFLSVGQLMPVVDCIRTASGLPAGVMEKAAAFPEKLLKCFSQK